jgi:SHS2 domain-containing protein
MLPRGHETFDHTADIGIRAWGNEFTEVFEEAGKALFEVIVDLKTVTPAHVHSITLSSDSGEELLLAWLKELLYIFDTERLVFVDFHISDLNSTTLAAELKGEKLDSSKHALGREVKAITRHQFKLKKETSRYLAEVILDI